MDAFYRTQINAQTIVDFSGAVATFRGNQVTLMGATRGRTIGTCEQTIGTFGADFTVKSLVCDGTDALVDLTYSDFAIANVRVRGFYTIERLVAGMDNLAKELSHEQCLNHLQSLGYSTHIVDGKRMINKNVLLCNVGYTMYMIPHFMQNSDLFHIETVSVCSSDAKYRTPEEFEKEYPGFAQHPQIVAAKKTFGEFSPDKAVNLERRAAYEAYFGIRKDE